MRYSFNKVFDTETRLYRTLSAFDSVYIFGAGTYGETECRFLRERGIYPKGFFVSGEYDDPAKIYELPVIRLKDIIETQKRDIAVVIGRPDYKNDETIDLLHKNGLFNVFPGCTQKYSFYNSIIKNETFELFNSNTIIEENYSGDNSKCSANAMIYACVSDTCFHEAKARWMSDSIVYIQGGARDATRKICDLGDDTGDNISAKNQYYNEISVGYWVYKNDMQHDILGLYHYSRGLDIDVSKIGILFDDNIDVILPVPYYFVWGSNSFFAYKQKKYIRMAIEKVAPDYIGSYDAFFEGSLFCGSSLIIAKRSVYCDFYKWMFDLFGIIEEYLDENKLWTPRITAYLAEILCNIYFIKNRRKIRIAFAPMKGLF